MGIWFIQTWMVNKDKIKEHDELWGDWLKYLMKSNTKSIKYFRQKFHPKRERILIIQFENLAGYENFFSKLYEDEKNRKFRDCWNKLHDIDTWKGIFWDDKTPTRV